jgi:thiamine biosynthesis lipoprotein
MNQLSFDAIGTTWQIDITKELSPEEQEKVLLAIRERIEIFDKAYSRFREDSLVTLMSQKTGEYLLPDDAEQMMMLYHDLYIRTGGLLTPLVGNILSDAGYDSKYSLTQKKDLEPAPKWEDVIKYGHPNITIKKPVILDFGAMGKGYLVDIVGGVVEGCGIEEYSINAGGDILHKGKNPIRIGLENPENFEEVIGVCTLGNGSLCGSAGNRRVWGNFTHYINPVTLSSPREIMAVWVVAKTAILADALASCLFFVPPGKLTPGYKFEYAILHSDHSLEKSEHFSDEIFVLE